MKFVQEHSITISSSAALRRT